MLRIQIFSGCNAVDMDEVLFPIDGIENAPVTDSILDESRQILVEGVMPQVGHIRGQPLGLIQKTLSHASLGSPEVVYDRRPIAHAIPRHSALPMKA